MNEMSFYGDCPKLSRSITESVLKLKLKMLHNQAKLTDIHPQTKIKNR